MAHLHRLSQKLLEKIRKPIFLDLDLIIAFFQEINKIFSVPFTSSPSKSRNLIANETIDQNNYIQIRNTPNPTAYNPNPNVTLPKSGSYGMGRSPKSEFLKEIAFKVFEPGPGSYNPAPSSIEPKITLKGKIPKSSANGVPGPGDYHIKSFFRKVKRIDHGLGYGQRYSYLNKTGTDQNLGSFYTKTHNHQSLKPLVNLNSSGSIEIL